MKTINRTAWPVVWGIAFLVGAAPFSGSFADVTVPTSPTTAVNALAGGALWNDPTNALLSDNSYASSEVSNWRTGLLLLRGFGFSMPVGATINGIEVKIERNRTGTPGAEIRDNLICLIRDGVCNTENKARIDAWPDTNDAVATYGGPTDLWASAWTPALINGNFGVGIAAEGTSTARVDHATITVWYTPFAQEKTDTTTEVTCQTPITLGSTSDCEATVTRASGDKTPSGTLFWGRTDTGGSFGPQSCNQNIGSGTLTCTIGYTPGEVGSHDVLAVFGGDEYFNSSSGETVVGVNQAPNPGEPQPIPAVGPLGLLLSGLGLSLLGIWRVRRKG